MKLIIPMAGRGSRFKDVGVMTPKPLIDVLGEPMYQWALKSYSPDSYSQIIIIIHEDHEEEYGLSATLKEQLGEKCVVLTTNKTDGAATAVLEAKEYINTDEDILIKDSDGYVVSHMVETIKKNLDTGVSGILGTLQLPGDRWSFAKVGDDGFVTQVAEKNRISSNCIVGAYYFRHGKDFVEYIERRVQAKAMTKAEYYIAPLYQDMIDDGKKVIIDQADKLWEMGTPDALKEFLATYPGAQ